MMRGNKTWVRLVNRLEMFGKRRTRRRYQRRRMFLEPLEARQLMVADLTDPADAVGGGTAWAENLLAYEDFVGPGDSPSTAAAYGVLTETPLNWQAAVGEVTSANQTNQSAPNVSADSTTGLLGGASGSYSIDSLTQQSSLGMLDGGAGGLPASAVSTITTLEQWDTNTQQTVQGLAAFDDASLLHAGVDAVDDATVEGESTVSIQMP